MSDIFAQTVYVWTVIEDNGDGSQSVRYFPSYNAAQYWLENNDFGSGIIPYEISKEGFMVRSGGVLEPYSGFEGVIEK